jgi:galactoside O-acetyltransferase
MNYSEDEILNLGFKAVGKNVKICKNVVFINKNNISIGDNSRIDAFCLLSAGDDPITIGKNVHIAAGVYLFGGGGKITLDDFSNLSSKVIIYTGVDDFVDGHMANATVFDECRKVTSGPVSLGKHALVGAGSIILPNVTLSVGATTGAMTFVNADIGMCDVYVGAPMKFLKKRKDLFLQLETKYYPTLRS